MPSFLEIGPVVPEKRVFEGFLPYCSKLMVIFCQYLRCEFFMLNSIVYLYRFFELLTVNPFVQS